MAAILGFAVMSTASGTYNSNIVGVPTELLTYEGGVLHFTISIQPSSNGSCNATCFEMDAANNTDAAMSRFYARLLSAYARQESITVGYDNAGARGSSGYIHGYRVG